MSATQFRFAITDRETLERVLRDPLPLGLRSGPVREEFFRDIYFDSPDRALRSRGITCRFRIRDDDKRWLAVGFGGSAANAAPQPLEASVGHEEPLSALAGQTPPARRLQAVTDPARLVPRLQMEVQRWVRPGHRRLLPFARLDVIADVVTVRSADFSHVLHELILRPGVGGLLPLDRIADAIRESYGLRPLLTDRLTRAEQALETVESASLAEKVQQEREVAVLVVDEGRVALAREETEFHLPVAKGQGEAACRALLRVILGSPEGKLAQLGLVRATGTRPPLEVWVARRVRQATSDRRLEWFAPSEVVARAGSPVLKDPRTLAALTLAGRSNGVPEWAPAEHAGGESDALPDVRAQRQSFLSLTAAIPLPKGARKEQHGTPDQFLSIQLGQLDFNARVLALAEDPGTPLLARLRFLSIFSTNLDEFFMIRVGGLKQAVAAGKDKPSLDGLSPEEQLHAITIRVQALLDRQRRCFRNLLERDLPRAGIAIRKWGDLQPEEQAEFQDYFEVELLPLLTPKAITLAPGHPFPLIDSLSLSMALMVKDPQTKRSHFVDLTLPSHVPQLVRVGTTRQFVALEEIVRANAAAIHPGRVVQGVHAFRITRLGDLALDESHAADLTQAIEEEVRRRGRAPVVRVELERAMPHEIRDRLDRELRAEDTAEHSILGEAEVHEADGLLNLGALKDLAELDAPELDYPAFTPVDPFATDRSIFDVLDERDVLVHHPFDSFEASFERLLNEAADDPDVLAIKLTLYRPGRPSVISDALHRAAASGKQVSVFVELKARFDEQQNIVWARKLEQAGIHVVTGLVRYKTHAKITLVVRRSQGKVKRYSHIGSGNYNRSTARVYTDFGLFTADDGIGADLQALFNELTGSSRPPQADFRRLIVAPTNALQRFLGLIERESEHAKAGRPARMRMKMNALVDAEVIAALYRASQAGVEIDMIVRGMCALRPGVPELSERIRVISILGRFLEHGRIYYFENAGEPEYFIGSADLRPRNLRHRVEVVTPVLDPTARAHLERVLETELDDPTAWVLNADGSYERCTAPIGVELLSAQEQVLREGVRR